MSEDGKRWPKYVACVAEDNKICRGWRYKFINS
jgi:hypothetical protein